MPKADPTIGQGGLFVGEEYRAPELPEGLDLDRPITFSRLIRTISDAMDLPPSYTTQEDRERIEPQNVVPGLVFATRSAHTLGINNLYQGVAFSATQFLEIARSPADLAKHSYSRAQKANEKRPPEEQLDRDTAHNTASRAAGHALESRAEKIEAFREELAAQRLCLIALSKEIAAGGRAHWSVRNLDGLRKTASNIIHGHIEIAAASLGWDDRTADDRQRALHFNLYGQRGHNNARIGQWGMYVAMSERHTQRQFLMAGTARRRVQRELEIYRPYLEAARADAVDVKETA